MPGKVWVGELPNDLSDINENNQIKLVPLKEDLLKNHGYCRVEKDGVMSGIVGTENGIFKVTPPAEKGGEWTVETLTEDPASDMTFADFDGDGEDEMLVMTPFHGDTIKIDKKADGKYEYETPVSYWMPFNGGIGFHDANWRSKFGGAIYQTSGSHGCVNLPPAKAAALYDLVYTGIPVICYN